MRRPDPGRPWFETRPQGRCRASPTSVGAPHHEAVKGRALRQEPYNLQSPIVTGPPAASTASWASARLATCSTVGFLSLGMSPFSTLFSIVHAERSGSNPPLTDHTQFLVKMSIA